MKCPACNNELVQMQAPGFEVDVCKNGCGGIWLDAGEFQKCNDNSEAFPDTILGIRKSPDILVDRMKPRHCPRCTDHPAFKRNEIEFAPGMRMTLDLCPKCDGTWLDTGELLFIRKKSREAEDRQELMNQWAKGMKTKLKSGPLNERMNAFIAKLTR